MPKVTSRPGWGTCVLLAAALVVASQSAVSEDAPVSRPAEKKLHGHLPPHFGKVVDEQQRQTIYKIQDEYAGKIDALRAQLMALLKQRDERILAVLTPQQRMLVEAATHAKPANKSPDLPKKADNPEK
jgi:Spy/CpxP family protein refolding chaperone